MKRYPSIIVAALVAGLAASPALAEDTSSSTIDPGFVPDTGQINPGHTERPWSSALPTAQAKRPSQEQARAALMMPDPATPSAGPGSLQNNGGATTGAGVSTTAAAAAAPAGPIGATLQTMPAKLSTRNDLLDHVPIVAWPLRLDEKQRQQIYQAVMADKSKPVAGADQIKPADSLSYEQTREMHALPQQLSSIEGLRGLQYVKAKNKVLLVRPPTRLVVDEITM